MRRVPLQPLIIATAIIGLLVIAARFFNRSHVTDELARPASEEPIPASSAAETDSTVTSGAPSLSLAESARPPVATDVLTSTPVDPMADPDQLREWARENPEQALAWMQSAPEGERRETVAEIVCARVAESNPAQAVALAERYAAGGTSLLENLTQQWAAQDQTAARAYAMDRPAGNARDRLLNRVAFMRAKADPADAARMVAESISPGTVQDEAAISVLHQWALLDANAALAWAQLFPENLRERALTEVGNVSSSPKE